MFIVKVPSLESLTYVNKSWRRYKESPRFLVIDSPRINHVTINDSFGDSISIQNTSRLDVAVVSVVSRSVNEKFLKSFSLFHLSRTVVLTKVIYLFMRASLSVELSAFNKKKKK